MDLCTKWGSVKILFRKIPFVGVTINKIHYEFELQPHVHASTPHGVTRIQPAKTSALEDAPQIRADYFIYQFDTKQSGHRGKLSDICIPD